jgi:hypothetical protein
MIAHWTDAGFMDMMGVYFQGITAPGSFAMRLVNDTVVGTDNWADISANEIPSENGYTTGGISINRDATASGFPTLALDDSEPMITGKECAWTVVTDDWATAVTAVALVADKATDQLVAYSNLPGAGITPVVGDIIGWTPKLKLTKV